MFKGEIYVQLETAGENMRYAQEADRVINYFPYLNKLSMNGECYEIEYNFMHHNSLFSLKGREGHFRSEETAAVGTVL